MCSKGNLLTTALATLAATGMLATTASAQSVEVIDEPPGTHCGDIVEEVGHNISGGCEIVIESETPLQPLAHTGTGEVVTFQCDMTLVANIDEDGTGYIDTATNTVHENEATGCIIDECAEGAAGTELEWPISSTFEYGGSQEELAFTFCIAAHGGSDSVCTILVNIAQDHPSDTLELTANQAPCHENPATELTGHWVTVESDIELNHTHYPTD